MQDNLSEMALEEHPRVTEGFYGPMGAPLAAPIGLEERIEREQHCTVRSRVGLGARDPDVAQVSPARDEGKDVEGAEQSSFSRVLGASEAMRRIYPLCRRLAFSDLPVVIEGETGTGKELLAESLHEYGSRSKGPFVVLDCTSIPPNLVESALFGHEKGSFTGATEARKGVFEEADGGTLLLDEIGDLELDLQAKLLRALERSEISRVGSNRRIKVNVRFMAATRRNLAAMVRAGKFRDDLYFRLAVTRVELPPLREREGDIRVLANMFWRKMAGQGEMPENVIRELECHPWPGNIRELQNAVARHVALGELASRVEGGHPLAPPQHLPLLEAEDGFEFDCDDAGLFEQILNQGLPLPEARKRLVAEFEQRYIERALHQHGGNVARAAAASGVGSRYFRLLRARSRERGVD